MKIINRIFVSLVLLCLLFPFAFSNKIGGDIAADENRTLAAMPIPWGGLTFAEYTVQFEDWISDNARGRGRAITLNNRLNIELFDEYPEPLLKGKQQHSFLKDSERIQSIMHNDVPDADRLQEITIYMEKLAQHFRQQDIEFFAEIIPAKNDVYSEFLPDTIVQVQQQSATEILIEQLCENTAFDFYSPMNALLQEKETHAVNYHVIDGNHWNYYGAYVGYCSIMSHAKEKLPGIYILEMDEFEIVDNSVDVNIAGKFIVREQMDEFVVKNKTAFRDDSWFNSLGFQSQDPWRSFAYFKNNDESLPKLVVVGDSFIWMFLHEMFAESFSEYVFIHCTDTANLNLIISNLNPDLVVFTGTNNAFEMTLDRYELDGFQEAMEIRGFEAQIISHNTPEQVVRGQTYTITIEVMNTGDSIWEENTQLAILQDGQDYAYRNSLPEGLLVKPGETYSFTIENFTPPTEGKSTYLEYQMVHSGTTFFGEKKRADMTIQD